MRYVVCLLMLTMLIPAALFAANSPADLEARRKALNDLLHEQWEYTLRTSPIFASILGDKRYNDKLDDFSQKAIDDNLEQSRRFLARFEAIDTTGFPNSVGTVTGERGRTPFMGPVVVPGFSLA